MAVPKKRTSKSKKKSRRSHWINKAKTRIRNFLNLAKSISNKKATSFAYSTIKN
uniref:Large ribosomal subunit protein bL32c n=1 Tax=Cyanidium caldarium TaxID=2771 RepID=RK32_CYACA|nr:ribosomal protein L32 [Cyanidium caldarium]O19894.3 RecName: Full=Large ribosomal subunit protein bL32c; AltName: Full=50S ribosomal protein L32, chloroplastic [Cyanidium caldarium]AAB82695.1 unknown [Cyanidium caldarium]WDB00193.1 ribosomal protein L32 [Cyanidium caldarium]